MRIRDVAALAALAFVLGSCATTTAPAGWLPGVTGAREDPYGGWVTLEVGEGNPGNRIGGELIAVTRDSLYILEGSRLVAFDQYRIAAATLNCYAPASAPLAAWTIFGALSTGSHGTGLVFSFPAWIIIGSISTNAVTKAALMHYPETSLQKFAPYARFPTGLSPRSVHLEPRPVPPR